MIEVSATTAIMLYLALTIGVILGLWAHRHYQTRKKKTVVARESLQVCEYCLFAYLAETIENFSECPSCHSFNKNKAEKQ